jgi:hypothetical protein
VAGRGRVTVRSRTRRATVRIWFTRANMCHHLPRRCRAACCGQSAGSAPGPLARVREAVPLAPAVASCRDSPTLVSAEAWLRWIRCEV